MLQVNTVYKTFIAIGITSLVIVFGYLTFVREPNGTVLGIDVVSPLADTAFDEVLKPSPEVSPGRDAEGDTQASDDKPQKKQFDTTQKSEAVHGGQIDLKPTPQASTVNNVNTNVSTKSEPDPTPKPQLPVVIPESMTTFDPGSDFDWQKGRIKFHFKADWQEGEDRDLLYLNYNGADRKNLFYVGMLDNALTFDTYTDDLNEEFDETNSDAGGDFPGKEFDIELMWDFTASNPYKRISINGRLDSEQLVVFKPGGVNTNPKAYRGPITNLTVSKE